MQPMQPVQPDYAQRVQQNPPEDVLTISRADLEALLDQREAKLREQLAAEQSKRERAEAKARSVVTSPIATHGGGPGVDNHQASWCLAEQEAARRGEWLDHWEGEPPEK